MFGRDYHGGDENIEIGGRIEGESPSVTPRGERPHGQQSIDVLTYNVHRGEGSDGRYDLRRIGGEIWTRDPDIVGLQEVDWNYSVETDGYSRSDFDKQLKRLGEWLDMQFVFAGNVELPGVPASGGEPRRYGIGILSKHEILDATHTILPQEHRDSEPRGLLGIEIEIRGDRLKFYTTHLGLREADQIQQVEAILKRTADAAVPTVLCGDFNATPESPVIESIRAEFIDLLSELGVTRNTVPAPYEGANTASGRRIDYVFGPDDVAPIDGDVPETIASDHLPVRASVAIR